MEEDIMVVGSDPWFYGRYRAGGAYVYFRNRLVGHARVHAD